MRRSGYNTLCTIENADVAELADAPDLGSGAARRGGSSPLIRTIEKSRVSALFFYFSLYAGLMYLLRK